jgi:hypothetical protein
LGSAGDFHDVAGEERIFIAKDAKSTRKSQKRKREKEKKLSGRNFLFAISSVQRETTQSIIFLFFFASFALIPRISR